jgi:predicted O-methyltransferase YrrM
MRNLQELIKRNELDYGGWCFDEKKNYIHNLVKETNSKFCVEIGVYKGSSLLVFAEALEELNGVIVGIDPWSFEMSKNEITTADKQYEDWIYNEILKGQDNFDMIYNDLREIILNNKLSDVVRLIKKPSEVSFIEFEKESIDILHIDGNHDEINVCRDILLYLPLVKNNGYIITDDSNWTGVKNAINKFLIDQSILIEDFGGWSVYKKI